MISIIELGSMGGVSCEGTGAGAGDGLGNGVSLGTSAAGN